MTFEMICLGTVDGWVHYKCFYSTPDGAYGEFFLRINQATLTGELRMKDWGYADVLIAAFARAMRAYD